MWSIYAVIYIDIMQFALQPRSQVLSSSRFTAAGAKRRKGEKMRELGCLPCHLPQICDLLNARIWSKV